MLSKPLTYSKESPVKAIFFAALLFAGFHAAHGATADNGQKGNYVIENGDCLRTTQLARVMETALKPSIQDPRVQVL
jgi:hypothetical protein